jgi:hypothetical protein
MKILWVSFSYMTAEPWHASLHYWNRGKANEIGTCFYDPHLDENMLLNSADYMRPDVILYTGMADWDKTPALSTFARLRRYAPIVHLSGDLSDPPYDPYLKRYGEDGTFDLTVNIDGNDEWNRHGAKGITLLSPTAPQFFDNPRPLADRSIDFGFAGGLGSPSRRDIVEYLQKEAGLVVKPYDNRWGSYADYARFLMDCKIVLNIPFSGSDAVRQVKGRVLEAGLAGCVLLDHVESAASKWFDPGTDFITYTHREIAASKAEDWKEAQWVADNLSRKVREEHSPDRFWGRIFQEVGL